MVENREQINQKKLKSITWMPCVLLKWKGRWDSRKGADVCHEFIKQLNAKLVLSESKEVVETEKLLYSERKEAAVLVNDFAEYKKKLENSPERQKGEGKEVIRANRDISRMRSHNAARIKETVEKLIMIQERMNSFHVVLDERINMYRHDAFMKIHAYVSGIRAGKLKEFQWNKNELDMNNCARDIYFRKHQELEQSIKTVTACQI